MSDFEKAKIEFKEAVERLHLARQNFNYAAPEFFDIANSELTIALAQVGACRRKLETLK